MPTSRPNGGYGTPAPRPSRTRPLRRRGIGGARPQPARRASATRISPSSSILSTAPATSPGACRCSASWLRWSRKGVTVAGLIYDPVGRDWRKALKGEGAWAENASGRTRDLNVAKPAPAQRDDRSLLVVPHAGTPAIPHGCQSAKTKASFSYRCAAYEYRMIAEGLCHFSLHYKLMPWDHAAGVLIHGEAGGFSALLDGRPYERHQPRGRHHVGTRPGQLDTAAAGTPRRMTTAGADLRPRPAGPAAGPDTRCTSPTF